MKQIPQQWVKGQTCFLQPSDGLLNVKQMRFPPGAVPLQLQQWAVCGSCIMVGGGMVGGKGTRNASAVSALGVQCEGYGYSWYTPEARAVHSPKIETCTGYTHSRGVRPSPEFFGAPPP